MAMARVARTPIVDHGLLDGGRCGERAGRQQQRVAGFGSRSIAGGHGNDRLAPIRQYIILMLTIGLMDMTPSQLRAFHLVANRSLSAAARTRGRPSNLSGQAALEGLWRAPVHRRGLGRPHQAAASSRVSPPACSPQDEAQALLAGEQTLTRGRCGSPPTRHTMSCRSWALRRSRVAHLRPVDRQLGHRAGRLLRHEADVAVMARSRTLAHTAVPPIASCSSPPRATRSPGAAARRLLHSPRRIWCCANAARSRARVGAGDGGGRDPAARHRRVQTREGVCGRSLRVSALARCSRTAGDVAVFVPSLSATPTLPSPSTPSAQGVAARRSCAPSWTRRPAAAQQIRQKLHLRPGA